MVTIFSNFCAHGGARGCANPDWSVRCTSTNWCCVSPGTWGGDFAMAPHQNGWSGHWNCHCGGAVTNTMYIWCSILNIKVLKLIITMLDALRLLDCSICNWWKGAMTSYCGRCCGQGGYLSSGVVRITYV